MLIQENYISQLNSAESSSAVTRESRLNEHSAGGLIMAGNRVDQLEELGRLILNWWMHLDNFQGGILYQYKHENRHFIPLCWQEYPDSNPSSPLDYASNSDIFDRLFTDRIFLLGRHDNILQSNNFFHKACISTLTLPMVYNHEKVGLLQLILSKPGHYNNKEITILQDLITESSLLLHRLQAVETNRKRLGSFQYLFDYLTEAMLVLDATGTVMLVNQAAVRLLGQEKSSLVGQSWLNLLELEAPIHVEKRTEFQCGTLFDASIKRGAISSKPVQISMSRYRWDDGERILLFVKEIQPILNTQLESCDNIYRSIFEHASDLICVYNAAGKIIAINPAGINISGYSEHEMIGRSIFEFVNETDVQDMRFAMMEKREIGYTARQDIALRNADGDIVDLDFSMRVLSAEDSNYVMIGIGRNITERKRIENNLKYMSHHDGLTGLYNRHFFDTETTRFETGDFDPVGIVICDIDGLKKVNDCMGHLVGDDLLKAGARILKDSFRDGDVVARIGGDEFGVLMPRSNWNGMRAAMRRLDRAIDIYNDKNPQLPICFSRGCAVRYARFKSLRETMREADDRMYHNKTGNHVRSRGISRPLFSTLPGAEK